jgi:DNA-binding CsgD family transcriptional regulator
MRLSACLRTVSVVTFAWCTIIVYAQDNTFQNKTVSAETISAPAYGVITAEQFDRLNAKCRTARKDLDIALLKEIETKEKSHAQLWTSLTVLVVLVNLIVIFFTIKHHLKKRKKVEAEKNLKEHELQEAQTRLNHNTKLVDTFTQRILDKNKVIAELEKKIRTNPLFNQSTEAAKKNLETISAIRILTQEDWEKFQSNINKVYPGLINRICDSFPLITDAELRMFLLIKLSVKNKDVSEILGISPDSVRKTRFRLKKKLNLNEDDDLVDFITEYNSSDSILPRENLN